jgi:hypothetical protein
VVGVGQEQHELVAAEAGRVVDVAHVAAQDLGELVEHEVAEGVFRAVVDLLEVVDVEEKEGERRAMAFGALELLPHQVPEVPLGVEAGLEVADDLSFELARVQLELQETLLGLELQLDAVDEFFTAEGLGGEVLEERRDAAQFAQLFEIVDQDDQRNGVALALDVRDELELDRAGRADERVEHDEARAHELEQALGLDRAAGERDLVAVPAQKGVQRRGHVLFDGVGGARSRSFGGALRGGAAGRLALVVRELGVEWKLSLRTAQGIEILPASSRHPSAPPRGRWHIRNTWWILGESLTMQSGKGVRSASARAEAHGLPKGRPARSTYDGREDIKSCRHRLAAPSPSLTQSRRKA